MSGRDYIVKEVEEQWIKKTPSSTRLTSSESAATQGSTRGCSCASLSLRSMAVSRSKEWENASPWSPRSHSCSQRTGSPRPAASGLRTSIARIVAASTPSLVSNWQRVLSLMISPRIQSSVNDLIHIRKKSFNAFNIKHLLFLDHNLTAIHVRSLTEFRHESYRFYDQINAFRE